MLLKEKLLVIWVIATVVLTFLATHALHYAIAGLKGGCIFGLACIALASSCLGALLVG